MPINGLDGLGALLVSVSLVALGMFFAAAETAVAAVRRSRVQLLLDEGSGAARSLHKLMENSTGFVATSQIIITAAVIGANTLTVAVFGPPLAAVLQNAGVADALLTLLAVLAVLVLIQQIGRALGLRHAEPVALGMAGVARLSVLVLSPLVALLDAIGDLVYRQRATGARETAGAVTEAGIMLQVDVAEEEGVLEEDEGEMIRSIFEFGDTVAREIMVPRIDMEAAEESATLADAVDQAVRVGHSRIPVYKETVDQVTGIFYVKDALRFLREGRLDVHLREVTREAYFVPETKKVDELLNEMQSRRVHVAIVVDEYGGTAGLVTIEDILEEIVGEIQDEFDEEEAPLQQVSEHEAVADALMTLDDVNEVLSIELEADDVDTLGGYVYAKLGRVPQQGDEVASAGARLIVEDIEGNRINKVRIIKAPEPAPTDNGTTNSTRRLSE
ncbi:MAG: hemolysin family protein, partial [Chloroflexota bacterium]